MISFDTTTKSYIVTIFKADGSTKEIRCANHQTARFYLINCPGA